MEDTNPSLGARLVARVVRSLVAGIVVFWAVAIVLVRGESGVPDWWLPAALALGFAVPPPLLPPSRSLRPSRLWRWTLLAALVIAIAAVVYGALATPSRHWDGVVALDAKALWLAAAPTLMQPYFADPAVFHHSPDFPLLLPLLIASTERLFGAGLGRIWLPLVYVLLLATVAGTAWRAGWSRRLSSLLVVAVGLAPELLGPGGGAVDSGYADGLLLLATTTIAAGLLLGSPVELALGVVLALACKPEGAVYGGLAAFAAFVAGQRRSLLVILAAVATGLLLWLPAQQQLLHHGSTDGSVIAAVLGGCAAAALAGSVAIGVLRTTRRAAAWRWAVAMIATIAFLASLPLLAPWIAPDSAIGVYVHRGQHWHAGLGNLPAWAAAWVHFTVLRVNFGVTFVAALLLACSRRRDDARSPLSAFLAIGLLATALPFVLTHEADVHHHLRASLPRLMLHWLGAAWLFVGWRLDALLAREPAGAAAPGHAS